MNTRASNVHHRAPPVRRFCADSKCTHIELWCMLASTFLASSRSNARSANRRTERPSNSLCIVLYCFPFSTNGAHVHKHVRRPSWATNDVCVCVYASTQTHILYGQAVRLHCESCGYRLLVANVLSALANVRCAVNTHRKRSQLQDLLHYSRSTVHQVHWPS